MKNKLFFWILSFAMVVMITGVAQADLITFDHETILNKSLAGFGTYSYNHNMPATLEVPPDVIITADLIITYNKALAIGYLTVHGDVIPESTGLYLTWSAKTADFDIAAAITPWVLGTTSLQVDVTGLGIITLVKSNLHLVYDKTSESSTQVPEPSTLLLLGSGLLGIAVIGRKGTK